MVEETDRERFQLLKQRLRLLLLSNSAELDKEEDERNKPAK